MHIEDYINTVGKQHKNERQNYEFHSISTLRKFIEGVIKNCTLPDVIKYACEICREEKELLSDTPVCKNCLYYLTCNNENKDEQICNDYDNII